MKILSRLIVANCIVFLLLSCSTQDKLVVERPLQQQIAFVSRRDGNLEIYIMDAKGGNQTNLTNHIASDIEPVWSPDGTQIAFSSDRDGNFEIYLMNSDGSGLTRLTNNSATDLSPTWSPDGEYIAFISDRDKVSANQGGTKAELYIMEHDGSNPVRKTDDKNFYYAPSWAADGEKIAVCASYYIQGAYLSNQVYILSLEDSIQNEISNYRPSDCYPAWAPDGQMLSFVSTRDGRSNIYRMNMDGTELVALTKNLYYNIDPSWSPDGKHIIFASRRDDNYNIYVMDVDGLNIIQLTDDSADDTAPTWSSVP